jgi:putative aldouronate transport system substrate-binding protein
MEDIIIMKRTRLFLFSCLLLVVMLLTIGATKNTDLVNGKFKTTKHITVEVFDRSNPNGSKPDNNFFTDYIKKGLLRDRNIDVTYKTVPRWTEVEALNNHLAAGDAADVCVTYSYPTIQTYGNMGGVIDMAPYLTQYKSSLPNLYKLLTDDNINWNKDPEKGTIWAIEARLAQNHGTKTFIREDWLKKLKMKEPTNLKEFEAMLRAFKNNASILLGKDADKMVPFVTSFDIGWNLMPLLDSMYDEKITDKEMYIRGFDDRRFLYPGFKEGIRILNKWYNEGLVWKDFPLFGAGDKTQDNMTKAGYVGAFMQNWDVPYRDGDNSIQANIKKMAGPDAAYIAVTCFKNNANLYRRYLPSPIDRKVFFPSTNKEPLASLLYLDWLSKFENRKFLQIGVEGVNYVKQPDGAIKAMPATGDKIQNSLANIDYTIVINGLDLGTPELTSKSLAMSYGGIDKKYIEKSYNLTAKIEKIRYVKNFNVGQVTSQNGMDTALKTKRDNLLSQAAVAKPDQFDAIFDAGMKDYLSSGGQAIIDERKALYEKFYEKK